MSGVFTIGIESVFTDMMRFTDSVTADFIANGYRNFVNNYTPTILVIAGLYLASVFFKIMHDQHGQWKDFIQPTLRMMFFLGLALQYDFFYRLIYNVFANGPAALCQVMVSSNGTIDPKNVTQALDQYFSSGMADINNILGMAGLHQLVLYLWAILVFLATFLNAVIAAGLMILSKMALALILFLCPLFAMFALFEQSKGLFDSYIKHLLSFALIPILTSGVTMIALSMTNVTLATLTNAVHSGKPTYSTIVPYVLLALVQFWLYSHVFSLSASLASGFSLSGIGQSARVAKQGAMSALKAIVKQGMKEFSKL